MNILMHITLAEVLNKLLAADLPEKRRRDLASAINCAAKLLHRQPSELPADIALLRELLAPIHHVQAGISPKRLAKTRMRDIDRIGWASEFRRAALFRDALMVGLLIAIPLRLRTFIAIELEHHLNLRTSGFILSFAPEDMKDKKSHEFVLPAELANQCSSICATTARNCSATNRARNSG